VADTRRELGDLHRLLIAPLASALTGARRLIIVPHGPLHAVPFHALWDGVRYVIEDCEVVYAPSVSVLAQLRGRPAERNGNPLLVGVSDSLAPQIEREIRTLKSILGGADVLLGQQATVDRVQQAAAERH